MHLAPSRIAEQYGVCLESYLEVTVQSESLRKDACTIVAASNLAVPYGSFAPLLALLNPDLVRLYAWDALHETLWSGPSPSAGFSTHAR